MNKTDKVAQNVEQNTELIVVTQLPVIKDQLIEVKGRIEERVNNALSLVCTEETYKQVKQVRSELNKEFTELEDRRKEIKAQILKPYQDFEAVYKDCAGDLYKAADIKLRDKIAEVENGLKQEKATDLLAYFTDYRASLGIDEDYVSLSDAGIKIGLSDSRKSLHEQAAAFLDRIKADCEVIDTLAHGDEVGVEYRKNGFNLTGAMLTVENRHRMMEAEKARKEQARAAEEAAKIAAQNVQAIVESEPPMITAPVAAPVAEPIPNEAQVELTCTFTVKATREKLVALRDFLVEGGYEYVC